MPTFPMVNPTVSNPDSPGTATTNNPVTTPATTSLASSGESRCVSSQSALQVALDYACGYGGADYLVIQSGGGCYQPNTIRDHAFYAFNSYYQKNPVPNSCNFGGTTFITSTDPSKLPHLLNNTITIYVGYLYLRVMGPVNINQQAQAHQF
ncbi:hypothetical protein RHSIM_Rhsim06G0115700 [Rhododendron simsii]|uniref:X8 domain-containing protein n=1 Tax=Rhododendron simsii TaxID=118357 RepID=A0A834GT19_RHOSS|nr:hypothetical protein RHSIM_Rhsim06G0115700 [Rhododendron simsii]